MTHGIPGMRGVDHIGLTVPDLDEAERNSDIRTW